MENNKVGRFLGHSVHKTSIYVTAKHVRSSENFYFLHSVHTMKMA